MRWLEKLQHIDSRIMYVLLVVVIAVPLIWRLQLPVVVSPAAKGAYAAVENIPSDKIALICIDWDAGTIAENKPQTEALIRHLFMRNKKFAILPFYPQGSDLTLQIARRLGAEYHKEYGKDWVHLGLKPYQNMPLIIQALGHDIPKALGYKALYGQPLSEIPMMKNVRTIRDVGMLAEITSRKSVNLYIAYVYGPYRTPIWYAATSVSGPEGFNFLDAGQIKGMLLGMKGAAEYEKLLGRVDFATIGSGALSSSHLLIIFLIILGNIGYLSSRRANRDEE
jgi:hypothetical protein